MKQYWLCVIGAVEKENIPDGGDYPMRITVRNMFESLFPTKTDAVLASGWEITEEKYKEILDILIREEK